MSVLRQDPTTGAWVILAPGREGRPRTGAAAERSGCSEPAHCPLCPGREAQTPPELLRLPAAGSEPWKVRVVSNKFAALSPGDESVSEQSGSPLFVERGGSGHHELIVESPRHDQRMAEMSEREVALVLEAYHARYLAMREDPSVAYVIVFKNSGVRAGASLIHPHSQLVATPMAPLRLHHRYARARAHYEEAGRCLYCDLVDAEREAARRIVAETERFVVLCPFASGIPFETWILPKGRHQPSFGSTTTPQRTEVAGLLRSTLHALDIALDGPDFNYVLHTAPVPDEDQPYYLWHLQVLPRIAAFAGFELGSGIPINTVLPEDAAAALRRGWGQEHGKME